MQLMYIIYIFGKSFKIKVISLIYNTTGYIYIYIYIYIYTPKEREYGNVKSVEVHMYKLYLHVNVRELYIFHRIQQRGFCVVIKKDSTPYI
jgi:hypothetical protein